MTRSVHYASSRDAGFENLPIFPTGYLAFRLLQVALAVSLLVICAWATIFMETFNWFLIYMLVFCSAVIVVSFWHLVSYYHVPKAYNYWVVLVFDIIFLPDLFPISVLTAMFAAGGVYEADRDNWGDASVLMVLTVIGFLIVTSFIVSLILHIIGIKRHRRDRLHSRTVKENHHVDSESQNAQATTNAAYRPVNQSQNSLPYTNHPQQQMASQQQQTANQQQQTAEQQQQTAEQQQQTAEQQQQTATPPMPDTH
ncbi:hypothetical protein GCG54_00000040 [Colletotrichum gloeosporioides]|uniref:MARVEL domain-containing protein n=1 Tax=Colletotrichum gloeosporioides TaxID=474922 RepID=A0A8H4CPH9_COLGL|nr:uncharacterized protein GCG54_00000040 [Colletotrichum gloeosporioides]KAF3807511.1 hypothetical protein GCG54_00000040 [Colletotrichum gloeosporioides]